VISYLDTSTFEYCERCRCKTRHTLDPRTTERACERHRHESPALPANDQQRAP